MSHLRPEFRQRAEEIVSLYPHPRSAMLPLFHLAQEQDGYLTEEAMAEIAELTTTTPAEVRGTATFFDLVHVEPVGTHVVGICTNIACLLEGGLELLEHAEAALGVAHGGTTPDRRITLEETECLAGCDRAPCVQVNSRFVDARTPESFDRLVAELKEGRRDTEIPPHGVLSRVRRRGGLAVPRDVIAAERAAAADGAAS